MGDFDFDLDFSMFDEKIESGKKCSDCENYIRGYCSLHMNKAWGVCKDWANKHVD
jgi:hypothetical protein